jgi:hypothetical protein
MMMVKFMVIKRMLVPLLVVAEEPYQVSFIVPPLLAEQVVGLMQQQQLCGPLGACHGTVSCLTLLQVASLVGKYLPLTHVDCFNVARSLIRNVHLDLKEMQLEFFYTNSREQTSGMD